MKSTALGHSAVRQVIVTKEMTATLQKKLIHPVYSTFWLALHAEETARLAIEPFFDENENAVGSAISLRHERMTAIGDTVFITAEITEIEKNIVICSISVFNSTGRAAVGTQTQVLMTDESIQKRIQQAYSDIGKPVPSA